MSKISEYMINRNNVEIALKHYEEAYEVVAGTSDINKATALRASIESIVTNLDDENALDAIELFPAWTAGLECVIGMRLTYNDKLYKCVQAHTTKAAWPPDAAPSLFAEVLPGQDGTDIGVWVQPDSTNTYMKGDRVYYPDKNGKIYESLYDYNSHSPEEWPDGWNEVS